MQNKKKLLFTFLLTAALAMLLAFSASAACAHKNIVKVASKSVAATCTKAGYDWYRCKDCGATGDTATALKKTVKARGHKAGVKISSKSVKPTCTQNGYDYYACPVCKGNAKKVTVKAKGHTPVLVSSKSVKPTCTKAGYNYYKCKVCGKTADTDKTLKKVVAKLGHKDSAKYTVDKKATCTTKGSKSQHCVRCGAKRNVTVIPAKGHTKVKVASKCVAPTCTKAGYDFYKCKVCGKTGATDKTLKIAVAKLGHQKRVLVKEKCVKPTCTKDGYYYYACPRCNGNVYKKVRPATGHKESVKVASLCVAPTCTEAGYDYYRCPTCKGNVTKPVVAKLNHPGKTEDKTKRVAPTCVRDGYKWYSCPVCGKTGDDNVAGLKVAIPALGHDTPVDIMIESEVTCARCGKTVPSFNALVNAVNEETCGTVSCIEKATSNIDPNSIKSNININLLLRTMIKEEDIVDMMKEGFANDEPVYRNYFYKNRVFYSTYPLPYQDVVSKLTEDDVISATVTDVKKIDFLSEIPSSVTIGDKATSMSAFKKLGNTTGKIKKVTVELAGERYSDIKDSTAETALMRATGNDIRTLPPKFAQTDHNEDSGMVFDINTTCSDIASTCVISYYFLVTYDENDDATYQPLASKYETALTVSEHLALNATLEGFGSLMKGTMDMDMTNVNDTYYIFAPAN